MYNTRDRFTAVGTIKAKNIPNKLNTKGVIFIKLSTMGVIEFVRTISFVKYPTKILPNANNNKGKIILKEDSCATLNIVLLAFVLVIKVKYINLTE